ncbi:MAG: hypothetical protein K0Q77_178 [Anaerosporomusa subterranea]|jgi:hypothetical protein|nr:hypothetical protein [Anaerosporomusa subterranea]
MYMRQYGSRIYPPLPPSIPPKPVNSYIIDCMYKHTYVWLKNGAQFWFYPTSVQYGAVTGYRWTGASWTFYRFDSRLIDEVSCQPVPTPLY